MKKMPYFIVAIGVLFFLVSVIVSNMQNTIVDDTITSKSTCVASIQTTPYDEFCYKVDNFEKQDFETLNGDKKTKFHSVIRISENYSDSQLKSIAEIVISKHPEINLNDVIMIEFYQEKHPIEELNYGLVKRIDGQWESEINLAYQQLKDYKQQQANNIATASTTWQARSKELSAGGKILGVYSYVGTTYQMIYKKGGKFYLHEFDISSDKNSRDELKSIGNNRFKYKEGGYEDILAIEGNRLLTYMPDPFNPSQLFVGEEWTKAQ